MKTNQRVTLSSDHLYLLQSKQPYLYIRMLSTTTVTVTTYDAVLCRTAGGSVFSNRRLSSHALQGRHHEGAGYLSKERPHGPHREAHADRFDSGQGENTVRCAPLFGAGRFCTHGTDGDGFREPTIRRFFLGGLNNCAVYRMFFCMTVWLTCWAQRLMKREDVSTSTRGSFCFPTGFVLSYLSCQAHT